MALILSLDTSTKVCSVALYNNSDLLASFEVLVEKSHSRIITLLIENVINAAGFKLKDLDAVAVGKGPGSYTGLRIGVSTAKGLAFGLDIPLIAVNTLEAMALSVSMFRDEDGLYCPMIDARRMEVYCAVYDKYSNHVLETQSLVLDESSFSSLLDKEKIFFFGNGAEKCKILFSNKTNAIFIDHIYPSAKFIGIGALDKYLKREFESLAYFEPYYLKDFVSTVKKVS